MAPNLLLVEGLVMMAAVSGRRMARGLRWVLGRGGGKVNSLGAVGGVFIESSSAEVDDGAKAKQSDRGGHRGYLCSVGTASRQREGCIARPRGAGRRQGRPLMVAAVRLGAALTYVPRAIGVGARVAARRVVAPVMGRRMRAAERAKEKERGLRALVSNTLRIGRRIELVLELAEATRLGADVQRNNVLAELANLVDDERKTEEFTRKTMQDASGRLKLGCSKAESIADAVRMSMCLRHDHTMADITRRHKAELREVAANAEALAGNMVDLQAAMGKMRSDVAQMLKSFAVNLGTE